MKKKAKKKLNKSCNLFKRFIGRIQILFTVTSIVKDARRVGKKGPTYQYSEIGQEIVKILGM